MFAVKFTSRNEVTIPIVLLVLTVFWSLLLSSEELSDTVKQGISDPESNLTCTHPAAELLRTWNSRVSGRLFCRRSDKHNSQNGAVLWVCLFARLLPRSGKPPKLCYLTATRTRSYSNNHCLPDSCTHSDLHNPAPILTLGDISSRKWG